jgi:hypothetical protein
MKIPNRGFIGGAGEARSTNKPYNYHYRRPIHESLVRKIEH